MKGRRASSDALRAVSEWRVLQVDWRDSLMPNEAPASKLLNQKEVRELMNLWFEQKVALVTGAASGMGLATAKAFAEAGAAVVLADFKEDAVKAEAQKLVGGGHKAIAVRCDVSDDAQVEAMVDHTVAEFGRPRSTMRVSWPTLRRLPTAPAGNGTALSGLICAACGAA